MPALPRATEIGVTIYGRKNASLTEHSGPGAPGPTCARVAASSDGPNGLTALVGPCYAFFALPPRLAALHGLWNAVQLSEGSRTMIGARGRAALCLGLLLLASTASGALPGVAGGWRAADGAPARHLTRLPEWSLGLACKHCQEALGLQIDLESAPAEARLPPPLWCNRRCRRSCFPSRRPPAAG